MIFLECQERADEENRTVSWLKYITELTDLSHVPNFGRHDRLPDEAVRALDAVMEDYRCNGPTVASQQVLCSLHRHHLHRLCKTPESICAHTS
jgi:hypothetical protein